MGCFSTCFPNSRRQKSLRPKKNTTPCLDQLLQIDESIEALQLMDINDPVHTLPDTEDVQTEKSNISGRKKVTFDLNLKIYENLPAQEEPEEGDLLVKSSTIEEENKNKCQSDSSSSSSLFSFPPDGYRYQNCDSDDEFDQLVSDDESDLDPYTDDDDEEEDDEESAESLFSLSIDSRKHKLSTEKGGDKEVNSPMAVETSDEDDKMRDFDSVLNPVENLTQWKAIKARSKLSSQNKAKENKFSIPQSNIPVSEDPISKPKHWNHEIAVDTSLSTWLVDTSSASVGNSPQSEKTGSPKYFKHKIGKRFIDKGAMLDY